MFILSKFALCVPDYENGLIWCQHFNGKWAPPFTMSSRKKKVKDPSKDESDTDKL